MSIPLAYVPPHLCQRLVEQARAASVAPAALQAGVLAKRARAIIAQGSHAGLRPVEAAAAIYLALTSAHGAIHELVIDHRARALLEVPVDPNPEAELAAEEYILLAELLTEHLRQTLPIYRQRWRSDNNLPTNPAGPTGA